MVKDRLPQLLSERRESQKNRKQSKGDNLELDHLFLKEANELHKVIEELKQHVTNVGIIQRNILASPNNNAVLDEQLYQLNQTIKEKTAFIQRNIKLVEASLNETDPLLLSAQDRMRQAQHAALTKTFVDTLHLYNTYQVEHRNMCKSHIYHMLSVAGHTFSDDQVENMLEKKNPEIFTQFVMADTEAAKRSLSDLEARHTDLMRVEENIRELHDLFVTLATIVEQQSQLVDRIENNVTKASATVECADKQLKEAKESQKRSRRIRPTLVQCKPIKCRIICIAVGVLLAVILLVSILSAIGVT